MDNYPAGAANDPNAPYNQRTVTCPHCGGTGIDEDSEDMQDPEPCFTCGGDGEVSEELAKELE